MAVDSSFAKPEGCKKVLIIEDNCDSADTLQILLQMEGHDVDVANNGTDGIRKAREGDPDVIFCDIGMPGLDGYQVARELSTNGKKKIKLVALTGYGSLQDQRQAKEAGFDVHLTKPVDPLILNNILCAL